MQDNYVFTVAFYVMILLRTEQTRLADCITTSE